MSYRNAILDAKRAYSLVEEGNPVVRKNEYGEDCIIDKVYRTTNESSTGYMEDVVKDGSSVLCVAASGDQYLNSVLYGAKEVDLYDKNMLTYYHAILKAVSASILELNEYKDFLLSEFDDMKGTSFLNSKTYSKVRGYLPSVVRLYYDKLFNLCESSYHILPFNSIFYTGDTECSINRCPYLDISDYKRLQGMLQERKLPSFMLGDIVKILPRLQKQYDGMIFSNIIDYTEDNFEEVVYRDGLPHLKDNGTIELAYIWGNIGYTDYRDIDFDALGIDIKKISVYDEICRDAEDTILLMRKKK